MTRGVRPFCVVALALALPASAQQAMPTASGDEIVVTGFRSGTLDLKRLLRAQAIYRRDRATFAPSSTLLFQIRPAPPVALAGMTLRLRAGDDVLPVAIDDQGRFSLPDLPPGKWDLIHNRGTARIAVRALVLSAGATERDRPLGDLRLQCRVGWELKKSGYSLIARTGFDAIGGCASAQIAFFFETLHSISAASVSEAGHSRSLTLRDDHKAYLAPLSDHGLSNDARIRAVATAHS